mmetsp:Transcript_7534/g.10603  ORF Transcript_7534/g.10603 Transcript_7534/m.10603 type:complete len:295 (+) Transcript_7534:65-949(+)
MGGHGSDSKGKKSSGVASFAKGLLTGAIEAIVCYPTELVKTQLQLQSKSNPEYKGMVDCAVKTVKINGIKGLYAGALPLIVGSSGKQSARWYAYDTAASFFRDDKGKLTIPANMFCGLLAGTSEAVFAVTPIETIKTRVADDQRKGTRNYKGSIDAIIKIIKTEGLGGIYRGVVPTIMKQGTNQMVRFPFQQFYVKVLTKGDEVKIKNPLYNGLAGALAGASSVIVTMPQDTVKSRMQSEGGKLKYSSTLDCFQKILKNEGFAFFFSGTIPRLVRVSLDVGITFTVYPFLSQFF